ncbi:MAG TPA: LuxR C-terminal-related transcriptional regulator [Gaiellaceae bacterium]|nr:LuxR C-terminal-related transcriptional regulator [Gaiellaceae bacterium]
MSARQREARAPLLELARRHPTFDFLESKIQVPPLREGTVSRTALVNRMRATTSMAVTTVIAPAGYGKTTLLAQWAARERRRLAWVTVDERDNDPIVLLRHIAAALEHDEPVEQRVLDALETPGASIWTKALPRLARALADCGPLVLVLDDVHLLRSRASLEAIAALVDDETERSMLVLAGRTPPRLALAPLRASGRLLELGAAELAMSNREAELLLRETGLRLSAGRTAELVEQCEGWPAALYLAALSIRDGRQDDVEAAAVSGDDRYLADYFRSEYLAHLRPGPLRFLRRTAVLDRMCGSLCDAMLRDEGSAQELEKIERANLFLVPLDSRREWYRYHHLFRDMLHRELVENEPELLPGLHSRAADWFEAHGDDESALEHAFAGGDADRAAAILAELVMPLYYSGRVATLERWLRRFEEAGLLERYPAIAVQACGVHAVRGRPEEAERWLEAASSGTFRGRLPDGTRTIKPWLATMSAWLCREGPRQMLADANAALAGLAAGSGWRSGALLAQGVALLLLGKHERADAILGDAAEAAEAAGATESHVVALGERALIAAELGDHDRADALCEELHELVASSAVEGYLARSVDCAATARTMLRHGRWNEARAALTAGVELAPHLTTAVPWLAIQVRLELANGFVTLRDVEAAERLLEDAAGLLRRFRGFGPLLARAEELEREVAVTPEQEGAHQAGLTRAELRLLPLLATHLSFREIAEQLFVSRNTIKTQAISVYRKLGVSSRSEAISEAQRLGLGEHLRVLVSSDR